MARLSRRASIALRGESAGYGAGVGRTSIWRMGTINVLLLAFGSIFLMPLIWMAITSVKPLDQTMTNPPEYIPRVTRAPVFGQDMLVIRDTKPLEEDSVIAKPLAGHDIGALKLLPASAVNPNGTALIKYVKAGREVAEDAPVPVEIVKKCPKGFVRVTEQLPQFSIERERTRTDPRWDCVAPEQISRAPHLFLDNYPAALVRMREQHDTRPWYANGFFKFLYNTLWICGFSVFGAVVSCTLVAYAFAFLKFPGRNILFALTLMVMMIPFPATMVPLYDVFKGLGWVGSSKPLWAPMWFGGAFYIFLLRQFFLGLPKDLLDAARIDGCSELEILWHVVVPLARPALAMVALFEFITRWKDFMGPKIYLIDKTQFTLALGLEQLFSQQGGTPWNLAMAACMLFSMPLIVLFLLARKTFMKGIAMTGIKG